MNKQDLVVTPVCLRSKRPEVRILSGIPVSKDLGALETAAGGDKTSLPGSKTEARKQAQLHRLDVANRILRTIGSHGRFFFSNHSDGACHGEPKRYAEFFFAPSGRLKYRDRGRSAAVVDIAYNGKWRGFTDGGTLRGVIEHLRDYIISNQPGRVFVQNYWGYALSEQQECNWALFKLYDAEGVAIKPRNTRRRPQKDPREGDTLRHGQEQRTVELRRRDSKGHEYVTFCGTRNCDPKTVQLASWRRWAKGAEVIHAAE